MKFKQASWAALIAGAVSLIGVLSAQVEITQQPEGVTVKTATDTLHLTVCGPTSIHVIASPDANVQSATPKQPWLIQGCTPGKFTFTMPKERPVQSTDDRLWKPVVATIDTGAIKVLISLD